MARNPFSALGGFLGIRSGKHAEAKRTKGGGKPKGKRNRQAGRYEIRVNGV